MGISVDTKTDDETEFEAEDAVDEDGDAAPAAGAPDDDEDDDDTNAGSAGCAAFQELEAAGDGPCIFSSEALTMNFALEGGPWL